MPPTSNHQYIIVRQGQKSIHVPSLELKTFQKEMLKYPICADTKKLVSQWMSEDIALAIHCVYYFKRERLFTKANKVKKLDVSNRIKAAHDAISNILGIDDSIFFGISAEKSITQTEYEHFSAQIKPLF